MALVSYDTSGDELSEDEFNVENSTETKEYIDGGGGEDVEPEYKMRVPKSAKLPELYSDLRALKRKNGRVLLTIPSLDELDSSDESDNNGIGKPSAQQQKRNVPKPASSSTGGLLSLLPPTRALIVKEGTKPMIPHQLVVKRPSSSKPAIVQPLTTESSDIPLPNDDRVESIDNLTSDTEDSDVDERKTNGEKLSSGFFSFCQPIEQDTEAVAGVRQAATSSALLSMTSPHSSSFPIFAPVQPEESLEDNTQPIVSPISRRPTSNSVRTPSLNPLEPSIIKELNVSTPEPDDENKADEDQHYWSDQTFVPGPERKRARLNLPSVRGTIPVDEFLTTSNQPVREVSQDDLTAGATLELMKSVTADESQYVSHRAHSDDDPGKLAHRKHQITWLAYQAQENEMELQNRWAEARRNKASNRAKYGF